MMPLDLNVENLDAIVTNIGMANKYLIFDHHFSFDFG